MSQNESLYLYKMGYGEGCWKQLYTDFFFGLTKNELFLKG